MQTKTAVRRIEEERTAAPVPLLVHPGWRERLPWLVQGVTGRGGGDEAFDLALFGPGGGREEAWDRWRRVAEAAQMDRIVLGRQVHQSRVRLHRAGPPGILVVPDTDGHAAASPGMLLAVTVADCVPVFLADSDGRAVALLHAGWRGVAAGILQRGLDVLRDRLDLAPEGLLLHAGPAICGECYEVGPEVHRALDLPESGGPAPVDLRRVLVERARELGIRDGSITVSSRCTRCGDSPFFSHRRGDRERQAAILGIRRPGEAVE